MPGFGGEPEGKYSVSTKSLRGFEKDVARKPHVASSICLRAIIFQNPEGTLWTPLE
jgi:hypothetical protein